MMKRIALLFLLSFVQPSLCNLETKKYELSPGINVVLNENFRSPIVIIGIIFHAGSFDVPFQKQGILELIAANFIGKNAYEKLENLGISCEVKVRGKYIEVVAKTHPKHIKEFFKIIFENEFSIADFEILKKQIIVNRKLEHNCFEDAVPNEISANIKYKNSNINNAFNEKAFLSISSDDVKKYFEKRYKKCRLSIVISGAIKRDNLIEALRSTVGDLSPRESSASDDLCINQISKEINIESKYIGRTALYFYKISKEDLTLANEFFDILDYEIFKFFQKSNLQVSNYACLDAISNGDCVKEIILRPKADVSLEDLQKAYAVFVDQICKRKISANVLSKVKALKGYAKQFLAADLYAVYSKIKNDYLNGIDSEIEISDPEQFNALGEKFLKENLILKITTRYRPDK